jgi:hypothetical protein
MRYLLLTYYTKPSGQIDEVMTLTTRIRTRDWQTCNVILDFKQCQVLVASIKDMSATKDWDTVVSYYYQYYSATIERLFKENGHVMPTDQTAGVDS